MKEQGKSTREKDFDGSSLDELIISCRDWLGYYSSRIYLILFFIFVGAAAGLFYSFIKRPIYNATTSFVLETSGSNKLGAYAGIASSFGIDLGVGDGGIFEGENILELYRSRTMISKALLAEYDFFGKKQLLIERFIEINELNEKWKDDLKYSIKFTASGRYESASSQLSHDSIMGSIVQIIKKNDLLVEKKDKKLNLVTVTVESPDELFAKYFNESLVRNVNKFYLDTKTKRSEENVAILQTKVDSVNRIMTRAIYRAATVADETPNQNPSRMTQRMAPIQNASASAQVNQEILATLLQNLELSKISLLKEKPLIQIVDNPILPLDKSRVGKLRGIILGGFIGGVFILGVIAARRKVSNALKHY